MGCSTASWTPRRMECSMATTKPKLTATWMAIWTGYSTAYLTPRPKAMGWKTACSKAI